LGTAFERESRCGYRGKLGRLGLLKDSAKKAA
jgi:hypothetical protein